MLRVLAGYDFRMYLLLTFRFVPATDTVRTPKARTEKH